MSHQTNTIRGKTLSAIQPFELADQNTLKQLIETGRDRWLRANEQLYTRGAAASQLNIVVSGRIRVGALSRDGAEVVFHFVGPGRLVGALDVMMHGVTMADATAVERSLILSVDAELVRRFVASNAAAAMSFLTIVGEYATETQRQFEDVAFLDVRTRAARRLMEFTSVGDTANVIRISQQDLASSICATRERFNRILSEWRSQGVVECLRGRIIVRNIDALRAMANPRPGMPVSRIH